MFRSTTKLKATCFILPIDLVLNESACDSGDVPTIFLSWITIVYSVSGSNSLSENRSRPLTLIRNTRTQLDSKSIWVRNTFEWSIDGFKFDNYTFNVNLSL